MAKEYSSEAHKGAGKSQKLLPPAAGTGWNKPTRDASRSPEGGREYEASAHEGSGKRQKLTKPAVGTGYNKPTPNAAKAPGDGKKGYELNAHSEAYHGKSGEAVGEKRDAAPMDYGRKTWAEGAKSQPVAGHEGLSGSSGVGMAEHHVGHDGHGGAGHQFPKASGSGGHSFGHPADLRRGALRLSGHSGAHRIGSGKK
jgi:hypothetical protein